MLCWCLLATLTFGAGEPSVLFELTAEGEARGDRLGFDDHATLRGTSFAGVTDATASPWQGGWRAYEVTVGDDDALGFWLERHIAKGVTGNLVFSFDVMADERTCRQGASISLMSQRRGQPGWATMATLAFGRNGLAWVVSRRAERIVPIEPRRWYRVSLALTTRKETCHVTVHGAGKAAPIALTVARPKVSNVAPSRLKIAAGREAQTFYLDNLRLVHLSQGKP